MLFIAYEFLDSPALCNVRIKERVAKGGHFVPPEDVRRRFYRSQKNFWFHYRYLVGGWRLIYNAGSSFQLVALSRNDKDDIIDSKLFKLFKQALEEPQNVS